MTGRLIISIHDVAPGSSAASQVWLDLVERHGMRASLLVIPGPWRGRALAGDHAFAGWLREAEARGHELVAHGWEHVAVSDPALDPSAATRLNGRVRARGCAEFQSLGLAEAQRRIERGLEVLHSHGIHPLGFTPPGWLASDQAVVALRSAGFRYTTTQWAVHDLVHDHRLPVFATSQRPGSRFARHAAAVNEQIARQRFTGRRSVRVALHPDDLGVRGLKAATERTLIAARVNDIESITYRDLVLAASPVEKVA